MLLGIVGINGANVFGRYILDSPLSWGEESMVFLQIIAVFVVLPAVTWDGAHVRMDLLAGSLPLKLRRMLEMLADLSSLAVAVLIVYATVPIVLRLIEFDQRSDALEIPVAIPQGVVPLGFALTAVALIARELSGKAAEAAKSMHH
ncbi:MAG: TRAP transporter small permease [Betaproteobacteria bacterium]|nr:TRAP transporter small permease [Betaproteobacteria bacterium]